MRKNRGVKFLDYVLMVFAMKRWTKELFFKECLGGI